MPLDQPVMPDPTDEKVSLQTLLEQKAADRKKKRKKRKANKQILLWQIWEEENERWIDEQICKEDAGTDYQKEFMAEAVESQAGMIMPLLRYQEEWLAWALKQEESSARGGILADEMGMGKTVQAISLVVTKREIRQSIGDPSLFSSAPSTSTSFPAIKGTLVICPVVAAVQWVNEIDRFTAKGCNRVLVYHGPNREKNLRQLGDYDFVITTYSTVEADYRKHVIAT